MPGVAVSWQVGIRVKEQEVGQKHAVYDQESRWERILEEHQGDRLQRRPQWEEDGCWFVSLERGECGWSGSSRWGHVAHGECMDHRDEVR